MSQSKMDAYNISIIKHLSVKVNNRARRRQEDANKTIKWTVFPPLFFKKISKQTFYSKEVCMETSVMLHYFQKKKTWWFHFVNRTIVMPQGVKTWKYTQNNKIRLGILIFRRLLRSLGITGCTPHFFGAILCRAGVCI